MQTVTNENAPQWQPSLSCLHPLLSESFHAFHCFHLFSMCGVRVGHHGPLEHDILKRTVAIKRPWPVLFIILLQLINREHDSLSVEEATQVPWSVECSAMQCDPRQLPLDFYVWWLPGETTGFFRLSLSSNMPFFYSWSVFQVRGAICVTLVLGSYPSEDDGRAPGLS